MAIFYMKVNIIGRSSGRSAIGAAAYRRSAKMQSVTHAAYQRGEKIIEKGDKTTHDYRSKGGVVHSEIMLPDGAPPEFMDAQTLWNAVEASEKRKDAQLAREIIVALPKEFNLEEQIEVLRAYLQENFVKIGICADFSIHDKGDGNPHAHIMLTTRNVTPDGFGKKNTNWNKKELLIEWRKAWANTNNKMFERKGLTERIDHRSYKEQGVDRLPYIHMGHEATALEKKGIRTRRGDYNREIQRRNEASETRAALMDANFKMRQEESEYKGLAGLDVERFSLRIKCDSEEREIIRLEFRSEDADERVKAVDKLQDKGEKMTAERQKMHFWQIIRKGDIDWEIRKIERKIRDAQRSFEIEHDVAYDDAPAEIERIKKELDLKRSGLEKKKARIAEITKILDDIEENYRAQMRQLAREVDWNLVEEILVQMREPPPPPKTQDPYDMSKLVQLAQQLDVDAVPEDEFKKILDGLDKIQLKLNKTKRRSRPR
jgi:hypothetical protein